MSAIQPPPENWASDIFLGEFTCRVTTEADDATFRQNYADALARAGYEVQAFADRPQAMRTLATRLPDLAIIDIGLGAEIDGGFSLCRELRALSATLPIIFLSARDSDFDIVSGLRLGADDYLTKDASLPHLLARIAALFRRVEAAREPAAGRRAPRARSAGARRRAHDGAVARQARGPHRHGILDGALARAPPRPREGPRHPHARRRDGRG